MVLMAVYCEVCWTSVHVLEEILGYKYGASILGYFFHKFVTLLWTV